MAGTFGGGDARGLSPGTGVTVGGSIRSGTDGSAGTAAPAGTGIGVGDERAVGAVGGAVSAEGADGTGERLACPRGLPLFREAVKSGAVGRADA